MEHRRCHWVTWTVNAYRVHISVSRRPFTQPSAIHRIIHSFSARRKDEWHICLDCEMKLNNFFSSIIFGVPRSMYENALNSHYVFKFAIVRAPWPLGMSNGRHVLYFHRFTRALTLSRTQKPRTGIDRDSVGAKKAQPNNSSANMRHTILCAQWESIIAPTGQTHNMCLWVSLPKCCGHKAAKSIIFLLIWLCMGAATTTINDPPKRN